MAERKPLDVWLKFDDPNDPEDEWASHEANTYETEDGYEIDWYHNDVGQVTTVYLYTLDEVHDWYTSRGYQDFTS